MTQSTQPTTQCPKCNQVYTLTPQHYGQTIQCTQCQHQFVVPMPDNTPTPVTIDYATPPAGPTQSNGMAIASLVCSLMFCIAPLISSIMGIIFGIIGLNKTKDPRVGGKGLAIAGIVIGGVGLLFLSVQIAILLPALSKARETANRAACSNNMSQIGREMLMYANDNNQQFPPNLQILQKEQQLPAKLFQCPSSNTTGTPVYVYTHPRNTAVSANTVLLYELLTNHRNQGMNVLFADGHVEWFSAPMAQKIISDFQTTGTAPTHP
jgi:prepilin-type processing-associated H-X9-DG protein